MSWILEKREEKCVAVSTQLIRLKALCLSFRWLGPKIHEKKLSGFARPYPHKS